MLSTIKQWMNWPAKGVKNLNDLGAYAKANWLSLIILVIILLLVFWLIRKIFGWIANLLS